MIDCMDRGKYFPSTILYTREDFDDDLIKIEYRVGFRVYPEFCSNWQEYKKYWPGKDTSKDSKRRVYFGDNENLDEWIPYYAKRIDK